MGSHTPGVANVVPDTLSRVHAPDFQKKCGSRLPDVLRDVRQYFPQDRNDKYYRTKEAPNRLRRFIANMDKYMDDPRSTATGTPPGASSSSSRPGQPATNLATGGRAAP